jgi:hypothetical protein
MTVVENLTPRVQYNYTTAQQQYPITFPYIERQYVKCMVGDELLVYSTDYQVPAFDQESLDDNELYLTLLVTPTAGDVITIYRETPLDQQAEFPQTAKFSSQKITEALDKLTQQQQEQQDDLNTCLRLSKNIPVDFNTELPAPAANQVIQWNEDGTQLINYDLRGEIQAIDTKADTAISTANTAESKADTAISTANTASTSASNAVSTANDAVSTANTASTNASNAVTTANTAESKADAAVSTANTASTNASNAVSTANTANTNASTALSKANQAIETANTASTNASTAISTANTASTNASNAVSTANTASTNASAAVTTANTASSTATNAKDTADAASAKVDEFGEDIEVVIEAAQSIGDLDAKVATATAAATTASNAATTASNSATTASDKADIATAKATEASNAATAAANVIPSQTGNNGKFLKTNGSTTSWETVDAANKQDVLTAGQNILLVPKLEYVSNNASSYIDTGITITQDDFELDIIFYCSATRSMYLFQSRDTTNGKILGISGSSTGGSIMSTINSSSLTSSISRTVGHIYHVNAKYASGSATLFVEDLTTNESDTKTGTYTFSANSTSLCIFGNGAGQALDANYRVYSAYCKVNNAYVINYLPSTNNDTICFYDIVTNTFKNATTGTFTGGSKNGDFIRVVDLPDAQIQSDWNQSDNTAKDYIKNKPTIPTVPTALSSFTDDLGSSPTHTHSQYITDISGKEDKNKTINVLSTSGTIALTDNSVNSITPSAAVAFTLPTITDNTVFHQIKIQISMSTAYSIDLGIGVNPHWLTENEPDLSEAGKYNLYYEYDKVNQYWRAGVLKKGEAS